MLHLGKLREPRVELPLHGDGLLDAGARNAHRVQRDVAFVQARDELAAHARSPAIRDSADSASAPRSTTRTVSKRAPQQPGS